MCWGELVGFFLMRVLKVSHKENQIVRYADCPSYHSNDLQPQELSIQQCFYSMMDLVVQSFTGCCLTFGV